MPRKSAAALPAVPGPAAIPRSPALDHILASAGLAGLDAQPAAGIAYRELPLRLVAPSPLNPRKSRSEEGIENLARSISEKGLLQPILVRPAVQMDIEGERFEIILGERRHAAACFAVSQGWLPEGYAIPARVRDCTDDELVILAAVENLDREDMEPLDEAELFAVVRPRVTPNDGETREAAVARLLHVSERTVFRRLALLRCAPEVKTALREKKITLAHAQAFSMGDEAKQRDLLADGAENRFGEKLTADDIRYELTEGDDNLIPFEEARFDPALYHGRIVEDPDNEDRYFADPGEFRRLQALADHAVLDARAAELADKWPWVEIVQHGRASIEFQLYGVAKDNPNGGAVVWLDPYTKEVEHKAPALRGADRTDRASPAPHRGADAQSGGAKPPAPRPPLTETQLKRLHELKTQALRRAVIERRTHDGRVPIALACLGMMGAMEIRGLGEPGYGSYGDRVHSVDSLLIEKTAIGHLLKTAALDLSDKEKRAVGNAHIDERNSEAAAAWFGALMSLPPEDLHELHARLIAERVGSWLPVDKPDPVYARGLARTLPRLGDSALAVAIATYTGAEDELAQIWQVDKEWFAQYGKDRLFAIAHDQCHIRDANRMKKGELVDVVMEEPKGFWTASMFPEARFQSDAQAEKAIAGPLPQPPARAKAAE